MQVRRCAATDGATHFDYLTAGYFNQSRSFSANYPTFEAPLPDHLGRRVARPSRERFGSIPEPVPPVSAGPSAEDAA